MPAANRPVDAARPTRRHAISPASNSIARQEKFDAVKNQQFFKEFSDSEIWELINASLWRQVPNNHIIIKEGEIEKAFYLLVKGRVVVTKQKIFIDTLEIGDCFGEMGFLSGKRRIATIQALEECTLMTINTSAMQHASINCQLKFHKIFLHAMVNRLTRASERIVADAKYKRPDTTK